MNANKPKFPTIEELVIKEGDALEKVFPGVKIDPVQSDDEQTFRHTIASGTSEIDNFGLTGQHLESYKASLVIGNGEKYYEG